MKKLKLLMFILTISYSAFSQGLTPTVQVLDGDTVFFFTIPQSKEIAKRIEANQWCDSMMVEQEIMVDLLNHSVAVKDSVAIHLTRKANNMEVINQNQETNMDYLNESLKLKDKKLKKNKVHKVLLGIGLGLMTILAIAT